MSNEYYLVAATAITHQGKALAFSSFKFFSMQTNLLSQIYRALYFETFMF